MIIGSQLIIFKSIVDSRGGRIMNKKVLMIDGSYRRKNTYNILQQIEKLLKSEGIDSEIINLFDYKINDCLGCEACVREACCGQIDDMAVLMRRILDSDGIILGSPVYLNSVSSKFKTFADRTNTWVHKPELSGKPLLFAATTTFTGVKEVKQFYNSYSNILGVRKSGFIARVGPKIKEPVQKKELSRFLTLLNQNKKRYSPSMDEIVLFTVGKALASKSSDDDHRYWQEKQWLDKSYYYPCRMNPAKKLFGKFMFKVISKAMM